MAEERVQRRLAAILAADAVGYSHLMELDEEGTRAQFRSLYSELTDPKIAAVGGRIVKTTGDGILVEFPSAVDAVRIALELQQAMRRHNFDIPEDRRIDFRVGINVGDVIVVGDDIHGDGVNVAARLEALCERGEVYVSGTVRDHVENKRDVTFVDLGEQVVKNITRPIIGGGPLWTRVAASTPLSGGGPGETRTGSYERRGRVIPAEQRTLTSGMLVKKVR